MRSATIALHCALIACASAATARGHPAATSAEPVPVLMYHVVNAAPPRARFPELYVSKADFAGQVGWLARHGYHGVTLTQVRDHWALGRPLPAHPIVLSFDDGYRSQASVAAPILRRRHWPGVVDLEVRNTRDFWGLPPDRVRYLLAQGWELASHTVSHPDLTTLDGARLQAEVAGSRATLQRMFHVPVDFFCYPAGRYDDTVVAAVRAAGYVGATTTDYGLATPADMFRLERVRVNGDDGVAGLAAKLTALQR